MQDALPDLVLSTEALPHNAMNEMPSNPANDTTDEKLMLAFSHGSPEAFTELFRRYRQPIYAFFRRRVADAARAEELAQETFLGLVRSAARYAPRALFRTYLYALALKVLRADRRKTTYRLAFFGRHALSRIYLYAIRLKVLRAPLRKTTYRLPFFGRHGTIPDPAKQDATESS